MKGEEGYGVWRGANQGGIGLTRARTKLRKDASYQKKSQEGRRAFTGGSKKKSGIRGGKSVIGTRRKEKGGQEKGGQSVVPGQ